MNNSSREAEGQSYRSCLQVQFDSQTPEGHVVHINIHSNYHNHTIIVGDFIVYPH